MPETGPVGGGRWESDTGANVANVKFVVMLIQTLQGYTGDERGFVIGGKKCLFT